VSDALTRPGLVALILTPPAASASLGPRHVKAIVLFPFQDGVDAAGMIAFFCPN